MYTAFLFLLGGFAVLVGDLLVAGTLVASQVWVVGFRLRDEEAMMAERFGGEWSASGRGGGACFPA